MSANQNIKDVKEEQQTHLIAHVEERRVYLEFRNSCGYFTVDPESF